MTNLISDAPINLSCIWPVLFVSCLFFIRLFIDTSSSAVNLKRVFDWFWLILLHNRLRYFFYAFEIGLNKQDTDLSLYKTWLTRNAFSMTEKIFLDGSYFSQDDPFIIILFGFNTHDHSTVFFSHIITIIYTCCIFLSRRHVLTYAQHFWRILLFALSLSVFLFLFSIALEWPFTCLLNEQCSSSLIVFLISLHYLPFLLERTFKVFFHS